ncbi:GyrI-like domain-containing protein [Sorangium cellulosum]|uniref:GyrI-like domain-containing protein n=1 Tax=Sorangium cellulosum TaxID=56 RepID=UPI000B078B66|nr:GyrI-like domain-containing protein [Sorangium cellulosum]
MSKVDLKRELKHLYQPSAKEVVQVDVPAFQFLMIDGEGDPNTSQAYAEAVEALFSVAYTTKFMVKKGGARDRLRGHAARRPLVVG